MHTTNVHIYIYTIRHNKLGRSFLLSGVRRYSERNACFLKFNSFVVVYTHTYEYYSGHVIYVCLYEHGSRALSACMHISILLLYTYTYCTIYYYMCKICGARCLVVVAVVVSWQPLSTNVNGLDEIYYIL